MSFRIVGLGSYLPGKPLLNTDLEKIMDTSDEWITSRTGISQRYFAEETLSAMAHKASLEAINDSGIPKEQIDLIIVCTTTPDRPFPSIASTIQGMLSIPTIPALDVNAVCSGFIYGLHLARALMQISNHDNILVVGCDKMSKLLDMKDRATAVLFGDGAGAAILKRDDKNLALTEIGSDGEFSEILKADYNKIYMNGQEVYKYAVNKMSEMAQRMMQKANLTSESIDFFVPHQANLRIIDAIKDRLSIDKQKVVTSVQRHANTSAATIPLALAELKKNNILKTGDNILMSAVGAGLTFGGAIIKY